MIITQRVDNQRTGANLGETRLMVDNIEWSKFGKLSDKLVDGSVYAQPLVIPNLLIGDMHRARLVVATMNNSVFMFDATNMDDNAMPVWHRHLAKSIQLPDDVVGGNGYTDILWEAGIVGTPVIDTERSAMWCVTTSRAESHGVPIHQLWKLGLSDGQTLASTVIAASFGSQVFQSYKQLQRGALTLANNRIYVPFASYGDSHQPYHGWILAYDPDALEQRAVFCATTSGGNAGIWQSGQGPAVDEEGNLYLMTGNGDFNSDDGNFGDSVVKLDPNLGVLDFFSPHNTGDLNNNDLDLGSGGVVLIPQSNLCVGGGKEAIMYLMDRNALGGHDDGEDHVLQKVQVSLNDNRHHIHGSPAVYAGPSGPRVYIWPERDFLKAYSFDGNHLSQDPVSSSTSTDPDNVPGGNNGMPGGFLTVSANGAAAGTGIVWANHPYAGDANHEVVPGVLRAFSADDLSKELWNSKTASNAPPFFPDNYRYWRDDFGNFAKFCCPTVSNGLVYQATMGGLQRRQETQIPILDTPALVNCNYVLVLAWSQVSTSGDRNEVNVSFSFDGFNWSNSTIIPGIATAKSLGLAFDPKRRTTFIGWIDEQKTINIAQLDVKTNELRDQHRTRWTSDQGVALSFGSGLLFVAWTDLVSRLNVATTQDGGATWVIQRELLELSHHKPCIVFHQSKLELSWTGIDQHLNFRECTAFDSLDFVNKITSSEQSRNAPAIEFDAGGLPWLVWCAPDGRLNQIVYGESSPQLSTSDDLHKRVLDGLFGRGLTLSYMNGCMIVAWQGMDGKLNIAFLNRGSVAIYGSLD